MPLEWHPVRAAIRYTTLVVVVALVAVPVYVFVESPLRALVLRLAAALVFAIAIFELRGSFVRALALDGGSALDDARRRGAAPPEVPPHFQALIGDVRAGARSRRYFEQTLWPRIATLTPRQLAPPRLRFFNRGPALADLRDAIAGIEREP
ncbi:MAG: hypothetical protein DMD81_06105 [Candidatus Rokuibacteriota bacterium]|nr:MAG: hypothetical protein DMD81_06105 [Candidatus Rokubacteria bacterium]